MVSCQKGPICHAYARQIGPFWQDTLDIHNDADAACGGGGGGGGGGTGWLWQPQ